MKIGANGLAIVKAFEGCLRPVPGSPGYFRSYVCPAGVETIGWGHTNHHAPKFDRTTVWSATKCEEVLRGDMAVFEQHVASLAPEVKDSNRFDALVSWSYNTGGPASSSVWTYARKGDVAGTIERLDRWNKGGGKVLSGLVRRRKAEGELFAGNVAAAFRTAGTKPSAELMPQRVDKPVPPAAEIVRRAKGELSTVGAGMVTGAGSAIPQKAVTEQPAAAPPASGPSALAYAGIALGLVIAIVGLVAVARKAKAVAADWA